MDSSAMRNTGRMSGDLRCWRLGAWMLFCALASLAAAQGGPSVGVSQAMEQGAAQSKAGNFAQAVESYALVTRLEPGFAEGFFNLGLAEERVGNLDAARADLEK